MANIYKSFRSVNDAISAVVPQSEIINPSSINVGSVISRKYDEPTYMTFKVLFGQNSATLSGTSLLNADYDRMPHPLFINQRVDSNVKSDLKTSVEYNRNLYSTRDYLRDCNEFTRAEMLNEFINVWQNIQTNFQWYFQSIEGLNELLTIVPERGKRVGKDVRLTFNMLEGIDHRISYLLNLYRKIAWDDTYQRWVLPDMMRFFDIQIYITEFRTFHEAITEPGAPLYLAILNDILPTYLIECQMCEFDINSFNFSYRNKLSIADNPEMTSISFKVKVGDINEVTTYPLFSHFILNDYKLNGLDRAKEKGIIRDFNGQIINADNGELEYASTKSGDYRYAGLDRLAQETYFQEDHTSGYPFYEAKTYNSNLKNSNPNYSIDLNMTNPTLPSSWVGNALKFGKAYATNFVTQKVNKAKMTSIPGLGVSFNEAFAAIQSKDIFAVLGLIRKGMADSLGSIGPSSQLEKKIDETFRTFLTALAKSTATDTTSEAELEMIKTSGEAINNPQTFQKIKDLSLATNLVGPSEQNQPVKIKSDYKNAISNAEISKATESKTSEILINTTQTISQATNVTQSDLQGKQYSTVAQQSQATQQPISKSGAVIIEGLPSSSVIKKINNSNLQTTEVTQFGGAIGENGPSTDINSISNVKLNSASLTGSGNLGSSIEKAELTGNGGLTNKVDDIELNGGGELGKSISKTDLSGSQVGIGNNVDNIALSGGGGISSEISKVSLTGGGGLNNPVEKVSLTGNGELGQSIQSSNLEGTGGLENKISPIELSGDGGLSNSTQNIELTGGGELKNKIDSILNKENQLSKATEQKLTDTGYGQKVESSKSKIINPNLKIPEPGKATE